LRVDRDGGTPSRGAIVYGTTDEGGEIMFVDFYVVEDSGDPVPDYDVYRLTHEGGLKMARMSGLVEYNCQ
jgi:hypothetical protein